jgi:hypothetical protein
MRANPTRRSSSDGTLPESKEAFGEIASFFGAHLGK